MFNDHLNVSFLINGQMPGPAPLYNYNYKSWEQSNGWPLHYHCNCWSRCANILQIVDWDIPGCSGHNKWQVSLGGHWLRRQMTHTDTTAESNYPGMEGSCLCWKMFIKLLHGACSQYYIRYNFKVFLVTPSTSTSTSTSTVSSQMLNLLPRSRVVLVVLVSSGSLSSGPELGVDTCRAPYQWTHVELHTSGHM